MDWKKLGEFEQKLLDEDLAPAEAMAKLPEWAKTDDDVKIFKMWAEFPQIDWSKDADIVAGWFFSALQKLGEAQEVDLFSVNLGDSPEVLDVTGYKFSGGQAKIDELLGMLQETGNEDWMDEIDYDDTDELVYEQTEKLPSGMWQWFEEATESDAPAKEVDATAESVYAIWSVLARTTLAHVLRHGDLDFAAIVGDRTMVPIVIGYEDAPWYFGSLTPGGWQEP